MKRNIRRGVWETNSSSVHSIVIDKGGREPSNLPVKDRKIQIDFGRFGKDERVFSSQYDKLSYLITCCYYLCGFDYEDIYDNYEFQRIQEVVCRYAGVKGIRIIGKNEPSIDHQSQPYEGIEIINTYHDDEIIDFVFNKYISLGTDCD